MIRRFSAILLACSCLALHAQDAKQSRFDQVLQKAQRSPDEMTDAEMLELLSLAEEANGVYSAAMAAKGYMRTKLKPTPKLQLAAARTAFLAGDYRTAGARLKALLKGDPTPAIGSEAAGLLYMIQLGVVGDVEDTFNLLAEYGHRFRATTDACRYDDWFLRECEKRKDYAKFGRHLVAVFDQELPLELERTHYWTDLDSLMAEASQPQEALYLAAPHCVALAGKIRDSKNRTLRYTLIAENLAFHAAVPSLDAAQQTAAFGKVIAAADAYVAAFPTSAVLRDIVQLFAGGLKTNFNGELWNRLGAVKREFVVRALDKLPKDDRLVFLEWRHASELLTRQQCSDAARKHAAELKGSDVLARLSLVIDSVDPATYKQQSAFLTGVHSTDAAVVNSLAAAADLKGIAQHLATRESWHLGFTDVHKLLTEKIIPVWRKFPANEKASDADVGTFMVEYGRDIVAKSPIAVFDEDAARDYISAAWQYSGSDDKDKSKMGECLHTLDWVPYTDKQRIHVFKPAYDKFLAWQKQLTRNKQEVDEALVELAGKLDADFKAVMSADIADPLKAPEEISRQLAQAADAVAGSDRAKFLPVAGSLYQKVRDFSTSKVTFGRAIAQFLIQTRTQFETVEFQIGIIKDQLAQYKPGGSMWQIATVIDHVTEDRKNWNGWWTNRSVEDDVTRLNPVFGEAVVKHAEQGHFWSWAFSRFRLTRRGNGWESRDLGLDVMEKLIETKALLSSDWRPDPRVHSGTCSYMWLIRSEFSKLQPTRPLERAFDDLFVEEASKTGFLDTYYFDGGGRDEALKVANVAAGILAKQDRMPLGAMDGDPSAPVSSAQDFWRWQGHAMRASAETRKAMQTKLESTYGKTRYDSYARGRAWFQYDADTKGDAGRADFFKRLNTYSQRCAEAPTIGPPPYLYQLANLGTGEDLSEMQADILKRVLTDTSPIRWWRGWYFENLPGQLFRALAAQGRYTELYRVIPDYWRMARDLGDDSFQRGVAKFANHLADKQQYDVAAAYSVAGLEILGDRLPGDARTQLLAVRSKALSNIGGAIPVPRSDPRYALYSAQADFMAGRLDSAWEEYQRNARMMPEMLKELDPQFSVWVIRQNTATRNFDAANNLCRQMIQWMDNTPASFDAETRARLLLTYADISYAMQEFARSRAQYERIAAAQEFNGTQAQIDAQLKIAEVDRVTKQYDAAVERLDKLLRIKNDYLQQEANYLMALVRYDREEYVAAKESLDGVFLHSPGHHEARILEGQVNLKMKKLMEATKLQVGLAASQRKIVPGRPLEVNLEDQNLAVAGQTPNIEIRAWTTGGDEEVFYLAPFGDSRTKLQGILITELAPVKKGDRILQLFGEDTVYYDYSEGFKKANNIRDSHANALEVSSDAEMFASSGKILSKKELEEIELERRIRQRLDVQEDAATQLTLRQVRSRDQIKPGNAINVRVLDPDRNITPEVDELAITVATSSGDSIAAFKLKETEPCSGIFEAPVQTTSAKATAFATDSAEGHDPNFAISSGEYPPWIALQDNARPKMFSVDLNDNVPLATLAVDAGVPGRKLKSFLLQTSLNGQRFECAGTWPEKREPWQGELQAYVVGCKSKTRPETAEAFRVYLEQDCYVEKQKKHTVKLESFSIDAGHGAFGKAGPMGIGDKDLYVLHIRGAFYVPQRRLRTFKLDLKNSLASIFYLVTVDGEAGETPDEVKTPLSRGVHQIDVYVCSQRDARPRFDVLCDTETPPYMGLCPVEMFDPEKNPIIRETMKSNLAEIAANEDKSAFDIAFAEGTNARVVRMILIDFETDAPAITKLTLADREGKSILPIQEDFRKLRQNDLLEIVPGDRITLTYNDPDVITPSKEVHEAFMNATFSNATLEACHVGYEETQRGERTPVYTELRRFKPEDKVNILITDPDMDMTGEKDVVPFHVMTPSGQTHELRALETTEHSGEFLGTVFPVTRPPEREGEIQVEEGDEIRISYMDQENTDPGIPWQRTVIVEQSWFEEPELRVFAVTSQPVEVDAEEEEEAAPTPLDPTENVGEQVKARYTMIVSRPEAATVEGATGALIDAPLLVEVLAPSLALTAKSQAEIFVQTSRGREARGDAVEQPFDVNVPGTLRISSMPDELPKLTPPDGYRDVFLHSDQYATTPLDDGRFSFVVPFELAELPETTQVDKEPEVDRTRGRTAPEPLKLSIAGNDTVYVGMKYQDEDGADHWVTREVKLASDVFFETMNRSYTKELTEVYVGESVYFRVINRSMDTTDEKDAASLRVSTASGNTKTIELSETFPHTGNFKGLVRLVYVDDAEGLKHPFSLPVVYGDTITATCLDAEGKDLATASVQVFKGFDGDVTPFSKRYSTGEMAVQSHFMQAEAYFELAKKHHKLGQESLSRREMAQARKLLEEGMRIFPDAAVQAQAEYLMANLTYEYANLAENKDIQEEQYREAIGIFRNIVSNYPESPYAPKAQYKQGLVYEKLEEFDRACEEYVKLSYRYPDNELVAETIARLGQYFLVKGQEIKTQADNATDPVEAEKFRLQHNESFVTAAEVFGRLAERFPEHPLASKTTMLSAQSYMRAEALDKAVGVFTTVIENPEGDKDLKAESMYWCGDCYMKQNSYEDAYKMFKKLTWDYPESKWAKFARGRLTDASLSNIEL